MRMHACGWGGRRLLISYASKDASQLETLSLARR